MSEEIKKERNHYPDRLSIGPENLEKLGRLIQQFKSNCRGGEMNRKEMLGFVIEKMPDVLSQSDLKELTSRYYDEERFLKSALEEVRAAKARGDSVDLDSLLQKQTQDPSIVRKPRKQKLPKVTESVSVSVEGDSPNNSVV